MNITKWLWGTVDWASMPIAALTVGILVWKKQHREFPLFFSYLLATVAVSLVRFPAQFGGLLAYFYVYWISDIVLGILNILVVYELFALRLFPRFFNVRFYRYTFAAAAVIITLGSWLTAREITGKYRAFLVLAFAFDFIIVSLVTFFLSLMLVMGREWKKYDFGIAFGFVIGNAGSLIGSAMWLRARFPQITAELPPLTYDIACLIWLYSFWSEERVFNRRPTSTLTPEMVEEARRLEAVLKKSILPKKPLR